MIRWLVILFTAGQCFAGSTNWLAQRPSLVSDYGNVFVNEKMPADLLPTLRAWWTFPAPFVGTQYCFAASCTNDLTISGATWANGAMVFDGADDYLFNASAASIIQTQSFYFAAWVNANSGGYLFSEESIGATRGAYLFFFDKTSKFFGFYCNQGSSSIRIARTSANSAMTTGVWHFVEGMYSGGNSPAGISIYADLVRVDANNVTAGTFVYPQILGNKFLLGAFLASADGGMFNGKIGAVYVSTTIPSRSMATNIYNLTRQDYP